MSNNQGPTFGNGKICYIEIPAIDITQSANFYKDVFGWKIRERGDGSIGFDDGVEQVSGSWITGRKPTTGMSMMISIMVDDIHATLDLIEEKGGTIQQPVGMDDPELTALFSDPAGNIMSLYQHRG